MVENYMKDIKESIYHGAVVSALAVGYTMLGKTLIKMSPQGGTLNVEVIGMFVGNLFGKPQKTPRF